MQPNRLGGAGSRGQAGPAGSERHPAAGISGPQPSNSRQTSLSAGPPVVDAGYVRRFMHDKQNGPNLENLRPPWNPARTGSQEEYDFGDASQAVRYPPKHAYPKRVWRGGDKATCTELHNTKEGEDCPYGCKLCHFDRNRWANVPTVSCSACGGAWCGNCLWNRMGENMNEVPRESWLCPKCRGICNCSAKLCQRKLWGWKETGQLHAEARRFGYPSVSHYLIFTRIKEQLDKGWQGEVFQRVGKQADVGPRRVPKRPSKEVAPMEAGPAAKRRKASEAVQSEVRAVLDALGLDDVPTFFQALPGLPPFHAGSPLGEGHTSAGGQSALAGLSAAELLELDLERRVGEVAAVAAARGGQQRGGVQTGPCPAMGPVLLAAAGVGGGQQQQQRRRQQQQPVQPPKLSGGDGGGLAASPPGEGGGFAVTPPSLGGSRPASWAGPASAGGSHSVPPLSLRCLPTRRPRPVQRQAECHLTRPAGRPAPGTAPHGHVQLATAAALGPAGLAANLGNAASRHMPRPPPATAVPRAEGGGSPDASHGGQAAAGTAAQHGGSELEPRQGLEWLLHEDTADGLHSGVPGLGGEQGAPGQQALHAGGRAASLPPQPSHRQQHRHVSGQACLQPHAAQPSHATPRQQGGGVTSEPHDAWHESTPQPDHHATPASHDGGGIAGAASLDVADTSGQLRLSELSKGKALSSGGFAAGCGATARSGARGSDVPCVIAPGLPATPAAAAAAAQETSVHRAAPGLGTLGRASGALQLPARSVAAPAAGADKGSASVGTSAWSELYHSILLTLLVAHARVDSYGDSTDPGALSMCDLALEDATGRLNWLLSEAEGYLGQLEAPAAIYGSAVRGLPAGAPAASEPRCPYLSSHEDLRMCLEVYKLLLEALPADDLPPLDPNPSAQQRVMAEGASLQAKMVQRLLAKELFVDWGSSDVAARSLLLKAWFAALPVLHNKGLGSLVAAVVKELGEKVASLAEDLAKVCSVADQISKALELRQHEVTLLDDLSAIGPWAFDSTAPLFDEQTKWEGVKMALTTLLMWSLRQIHALCYYSSQLGLAGFGFLTRRLVKALLDPHAVLGSRDIRLMALRLLGTIFEGLRHVSWDELNAAERAEMRGVHERMCMLVESEALPLLESQVAEDNPCRRQGRPTGTAIGAHEIPRFAKVEALAVCYGYLLNQGTTAGGQESRGWDWQKVEGAIARPYSFLSTFWLTANSLYRHLAVCMLYKAVEHAPLALRSLPHATCALVAWVSAVLESDGLIMAQQLTKTLAENQHTGQLFQDITPQQIDMLPDDITGTVRAELLSLVVGNISTSQAWRSQLPVVLGGIDKMLGERSKEVAASSDDSVVELLTWQSATAAALMALLGAIPNPQGAGQGSLAGEVKRLLNRFASWAVEACAVLLKERAEAEAAKAAGPKGYGGADGPQEEDWKGPRVRQQLKATVFGQLGSFWRLMEKWGAPGSLANDAELLLPVCTLVCSCLEVCSGAEEANPVESVMLEILAESLTSLSNRLSNLQRQQQQEAGQAAHGQELHPLCRYVLATFVRRYLLRASLVDRTDKHYNERAAVNAIRFLQKLLEESSMRSAGARLEALRLLLHPLLEMMRPSGGTASVAAKVAMYRLLEALFSGEGLAPVPYDDLLSPSYSFQQARQLSRQQRQELQLQCFMTCLCQDILECVAGAVSASEPEGAQARLEHVPKVAQGPLAATLARPLLPASRLRDKWDMLVNQLIAVLEAAAPLTLIDSTYSNRGLGLVVAKLIASSAAEGDTRSGSGDPAAAPLVRPGVFQPDRLRWPLADGALRFVRTLASLPQEQGPASKQGAIWAMACFPALHFLLVSPHKDTSRRRREFYDRLREAIEVRLTSAAVQKYSFKKPPQQQSQQQGPVAAEAGAVQLARQALSAGQPPQQLQQQQQSAGPQRPAAQGAGHSGAQQAAGKHGMALAEPHDTSLAVASTMPEGSVVNVLALLCAVPVCPKAEAGSPPMAVLRLRDFSGAGNQEVEVTVVLQGAGLVQKAVRLANSTTHSWALPGHEPLVLRLSHLQLEAGGRCRSTSKTSIEEPAPTDDAARQLAKVAQALAGLTPPPPVAQTQTPSHSIGSIRPQASQQRETQQHGMHSAPTRPLHFSQALSSAGTALSAGKCTSSGVAQPEAQRVGGGGGLAGAAGGADPNKNLRYEFLADVRSRVVEASKGTGREYSNREVNAVLKKLSEGKDWRQLLDLRQADKLVKLATDKLRDEDWQRQQQEAAQSQAGPT